MKDDTENAEKSAAVNETLYGKWLLVVIDEPSKSGIK